uniref:Putative secreted protein n=1 Tax=Anopheles marajoara TaxID=58244 RepID=A0A2M4CAN3_9DIPT
MRHLPLIGKSSASAYLSQLLWATPLDATAAAVSGSEEGSIKGVLCASYVLTPFTVSPFGRRPQHTTRRYLLLSSRETYHSTEHK